MLWTDVVEGRLPRRRSARMPTPTYRSRRDAVRPSCTTSDPGHRAGSLIRQHDAVVVRTLPSSTPNHQLPKPLDVSASLAHFNETPTRSRRDAEGRTTKRTKSRNPGFVPFVFF